ncbi:hypothetical protein [Sporichthya polymorpha]|uniref:hypothetical protein n=1 Tax=Sporichthya polymorpha TaxID=35751 RepID=UPI00037DC728|nr:hypothetical protein [Sporichthya polymorpha]
MLNRPLVRILIFATFAGCVLDAASAGGTAPPGVGGSVVSTVSANLTYGLLGAMFAGLVAAAGHEVVADAWHSSGVGIRQRVASCIWLAASLGIAARALTVFAVAIGGLFDGLRRKLHWGSTVPIDHGQLLQAQARLLGCYILAAVLGALLALAIRSFTASILTVAAMSALYLPVTGALAERASSLLEVLPWLPFGSLRGTLTGNGGIFGARGVEPSRISTESALLLFVVWLLALAALAIRSGVSGDGVRILAGASPIAAGVGVAVFAGLVIPKAIADDVPWQWRPAWRHAHDAGWDSRQVASRWAELTKEGRADQTEELFAPSFEASAAPPDAAEVLRLATSIEVEPTSSMLFPTITNLWVRFASPFQTGNVRATGASFQIVFEQVGERWLIQAIAGPTLEATIAP